MWQKHETHPQDNETVVEWDAHPAQWAQQVNDSEDMLLHIH